MLSSSLLVVSAMVLADRKAEVTQADFSCFILMEQQECRDNDACRWDGTSCIPYRSEYMCSILVGNQCEVTGQLCYWNGRSCVLRPTSSYVLHQCPLHDQPLCQDLSMCTWNGSCVLNEEMPRNPGFICPAIQEQQECQDSSPMCNWNDGRCSPRDPSTFSNKERCRAVNVYPSIQAEKLCKWVDVQKYCEWKDGKCVGKDGLSTGAIVGIVLGCVVCVILVAVAIVLACRKNSNTPTQATREPADE